jgi:hypothetical protein
MQQNIQNRQIGSIGHSAASYEVACSIITNGNAAICEKMQYLQGTPAFVITRRIARMLHTKIGDAAI